MDEEDWLNRNDVELLLRYVLPNNVSERKLRLFNCAVVRVIWPVLPYQASRTCVEQSERAADTVVPRRTWDKTDYGGGLAINRAGRAFTEAQDQELADDGSDDGLMTALADAEDAARAAWLAHKDTAHSKVNEVCRLVSGVLMNHVAHRAASPNLAFLLRDVVNPHYTHGRPPLTPDTVALAQATYDSWDKVSGHLDQDRVLILADSLEENGCPHTVVVRRRVYLTVRCTHRGWCVSLNSNSEPVFSSKKRETVLSWAKHTYGVTEWGQRKKEFFGYGMMNFVVPHPLLSHLRSRGPHVRGCWALDITLGKE